MCFQIITSENVDSAALWEHEKEQQLHLKWPVRGEGEGFQVHSFHDEDNPEADMTPCSETRN